MASRVRVAAFLLLSCAAVSRADCPAGRWIPLAPLNEPRQELAAAELDGKVYTIGGLAGRANANEIYDVGSNSWSLGTDFPVGTDHAWAVSLAGRIYAGGGRTPRVFSYDPATNAWSEVASSTHLHGGTPAAGVIGGRIYVAGGTGGGMAGNEVEVYDPETNAWTPVAPMSCARNHVGGAVLAGKLYVAGGRPGNQDCFEVYDPATNAWTRKPPMPTGRSGVAAAALGSCVYLFGGEGNPADPNGIFHEVEAYDPRTDSWTRLPPMAVGRHGIYAAVTRNVAYLPGGATRAGFGVTGWSDAYVVDDPTPIPRQPVVLSPRRRRN